MRRLICLISLPALLLLTLCPPAARAQGGGGKDAAGVFHVSPELMDQLTAWSSPASSIEALLVSQYPAIVEEYAQRVGELYEDLPGHFAKSYPESYAEVQDIIAQEAGDGIALVGYLLTRNGPDYRAWQEEKLLLTQNLTLPQFLALEHPELPTLEVLQSLTPAAQGKSLVDFVRDQGGNEDEASLLLQQVAAIPMPFPATGCVCWVALTFSRAPSGWATRTTDRDSTYWDGGYRRLLFERSFDGAAHEVDFHRTSHLRRYEAGRELDASRTAMRVRMHCTDAGIPGGVQCQKQGCTGEMAVRVEYGSQVHQATESRGFFPHAASTVAADLATLNYDQEGQAAPVELFRKGVELAGSTTMNWDPDSLSTLLGGVVDIVELAAGGSGTALDLLQGNLVDDTVNAIFGLIVWEGQPSDGEQDWSASYDSIRSGTIALAPSVSHSFELTAYSETRGDGRGWFSESLADVRSYDYFVTALRNFQCTADATPPPPRACWSYETSGNPLGVADIEGLIDAWVTTELGASPTNISGRNGGC